MNIIKDNLGKVALGVTLLILVITLVIIKNDVKNATIFTTGNSVEYTMDEYQDIDKPIDEIAKENAEFSVNLAQNPWSASSEMHFEYSPVLQCKFCKNLVQFSEKDCPFCKKSLGLSSKEEELALQEQKKFNDDDQDGIINGLEDAFAFMDKTNKYDAYLDQDRGGFTNLDKITGGKTLEEQVVMLKAGKNYIYNPEDPRDQPNQVNLLRVRSLNMA